MNAEANRERKFQNQKRCAERAETPRSTGARDPPTNEIANSFLASCRSGLAPFDYFGE